MKKIISAVLIILVTGLAVWYFGFGKNEDISVVTENINEVKDVKEKKRIIAVGDSLTAGYGLTASESYPGQLAKKLDDEGYDVEVINAGISGETSAGLLERIEFIKKQKPDIVLITTGGNDALRALPVSNTETNLTKIVQSLKQSVEGDKIFLMQIQAPQNLGVEYVNKFNKMYETLAQKEKIKLVPFVVSEVYLRSDYLQSDGVHPTQAGYSYIVEKYIYPHVTKEL